jgi:hypothetical protein
MLVAYDGKWDDTYPEKLAERVRSLAANPSRLAVGSEMRAKASEFDYSKVAMRAASVIDDVLGVEPR